MTNHISDSATPPSNASMADCGPVMATLLSPSSTSRRNFLRGTLAVTASAAAQNILGYAASSAKTPPPPRKTMAGCVGITNAAAAQAVHAQVVRNIQPIVVLEKQVRQARQAQAGHGPWPWNFAYVRAMHQAGIKVVVSLLWGNWGSHGRPLPHPNSARGRQWLQTVQDYVDILGDSLYYVVLDNEPITYLPAADWHTGSARQLPVFTWYNAVTAAIHRSRPQLPVAAPANNLLNQVRLLEAHRPGVKPWVKWGAVRSRQLFDWSNHNPHISAVDLHLYVPHGALLAKDLSYARTFTDKPFLITEWGEIPVLKDWIKRPLAPRFLATWKATPHQSNGDYVLACFQKPTTPAQWNDFMATAPLSPTFLRDSYAAMCRHDVLLETYFCWGQWFSRLHPENSMTALYANKTVVTLHGQPQPNYHFVKWFKQMAAQMPAPAATVRG